MFRSTSIPALPSLFCNSVTARLGSRLCFDVFIEESIKYTFFFFFSLCVLSGQAIITYFNLLTVFSSWYTSGYSSFYWDPFTVKCVTTNRIKTMRSTTVSSTFTMWKDTKWSELNPYPVSPPRTEHNVTENVFWLSTNARVSMSLKNQRGSNVKPCPLISTQEVFWWKMLIRHIILLR